MIMTTAEYAKAIDKSIFPGMQGGPLMHVIAAKAVAFREALKPSFKEYQKKVVANAKALAEEFLSLDYHLVSGGTDNHLILVNLMTKGVTGKAAEAALDKAGMTVNKNAVPFDTQSPFITSGIRVGTPAATTRGFGVDDMKQIARWIDRAVRNVENESELATIKAEVLESCNKHPLYPGLE
jgi:glycine hydroxymethyltransferase